MQQVAEHEKIICAPDHITRFHRSRSTLYCIINVTMARRLCRKMRQSIGKCCDR
jgi:hypothetical protein